MAEGMVSVATREHAVRLYRSDREITGIVGGDLVAAVRSRASVFVIATEQHLLAFRTTLATAGIDLDEVSSAGRLVMLDAERTLGWLYPDGRFDLSVFEATTSPIRIAAATGDPIWAYGEMVALLWQRGDVVAAVELEQLWCELADEVPMTLLCSYPTTAEPADPALDDVLRLHTSVLTPVPYAVDADVSRWFAGNAHSPAAARRFVADTVLEWDCDDVVEDCLLVVSEMATDAVLHARSDFSVSLTAVPGGVEIVVGDRSTQPPTLEPPLPTMTHGRGLPMTAGSTAEWAHPRTSRGTLVRARIVCDELRGST